MSGEEQRRMQLTGLHHLTAIVRDLDRTTTFYRDVLGLEVVQQGASDDDPDARHFWFAAGGAAGSGLASRAGHLISFMEYPAMPQGVQGTGSVQHFAFAVSSGEELQAWRDYLPSRGVQCTEVFERNGFRSVYIRDPDGHIVEIATRA